MGKTDPRNIGRYARVMFEDFGICDGVIVGVNTHDTEYTWFGLGGGELINVYPNQVIEVGRALAAKDSGLSRLERN